MGTENRTGLRAKATRLRLRSALAMIALFALAGVGNAMGRWVTIPDGLTTVGWGLFGVAVFASAVFQARDPCPQCGERYFGKHMPPILYWVHSGKGCEACGAFPEDDPGS